MTVGSTRTYALAKGDGMDVTSGRPVWMELGRYDDGASRRRWAGRGARRAPPATGEGMQLWALPLMAAADIVS